MLAARPVSTSSSYRISNITCHDCMRQSLDFQRIVHACMPALSALAGAFPSLQYRYLTCTWYLSACMSVCLPACLPTCLPSCLHSVFACGQGSPPRGSFLLRPPLLARERPEPDNPRGNQTHTQTQTQTQTQTPSERPHREDASLKGGRKARAEYCRPEAERRIGRAPSHTHEGDLGRAEGREKAPAEGN
jgi:hypothetical protein